MNLIMGEQNFILLSEVKRLLALNIPMKTKEMLYKFEKALANGWGLSDKQKNVITAISRENGERDLISSESYGLCPSCHEFGSLMAVRENIKYAFKCSCPYGQRLGKDFIEWKEHYKDDGFEIFKPSREFDLLTEEQRSLLYRFIALIGANRVKDQSGFLKIFVPLLQDMLNKKDKDQLNGLFTELKEHLSFKSPEEIPANELTTNELPANELPNELDQFLN